MLYVSGNYRLALYKAIILSISATFNMFKTSILALLSIGGWSNRWETRAFIPAKHPPPMTWVCADRMLFIESMAVAQGT